MPLLLERTSFQLERADETNVALCGELDDKVTMVECGVLFIVVLDTGNQHCYADDKLLIGNSYYQRLGQRVVSPSVLEPCCLQSWEAGPEAYRPQDHGKRDKKHAKERADQEGTNDLEVSVKSKPS